MPAQEKDPERILAEAVRAARAAARERPGGEATLPKIEKATSISTSYTSQIEHGKKVPGYETLMRLARHLNANVELLELYWIRATVLRQLRKHGIDATKVAAAFGPEYMREIQSKANKAARRAGVGPTGDLAALLAILAELPLPGADDE